MIEAGYNLVIDSDYQFCNATGELGEKSQTAFSEKLTEIVTRRVTKASQPVIDASKIIEEYFPFVNADVFVSHSHKDRNLALQLAAYLENRGLTCFVDSTVWKSCDFLIKKINDDYSRNEKGLYDYYKTLDVASKMYMTLSVSLQQLIYRTPIFIFLNTGNSTFEDYLKGSYTTSPWLFYELSTANSYLEMLKSRITLMEGRNFSIPANVIYPIELKNFQKVKHTDLQQLSYQWYMNK